MTYTNVIQGKASEMQVNDEVHVLGSFVKVKRVWTQGTETHFEINTSGTDIAINILHCPSEFEMLFKRGRR